MNSNYSKSNQSKTPSSSSVSLNNFNFDFDLGIGSNRSKPLNDHKKPNPNNSSYSYSTPSSQPRPAWQPNKPSWTHQPAPVHTNPTGLPGGPTSMAGDIFGKTWGSTQTQPTIVGINASKSTPTASFPSKGSAGIDIDFNGFAASNQSPPVQPYGGGDPMDMLFSASAASAGGASGGKPASEMDDWGLESDFGGGSHDGGGSTMELEGLPPPPAGISGSTAKGKGMDSYKQGQFADAIKWLSWAVILLEKGGDSAATFEALSSRASCYKEVGEYKKAVADCTKVLENDKANVSVLVQRALLYESMEKYKLGAEDLRTVLKIDPSNRIAKSTVHRLAKMAE
ncbi:putative tetratricopeptide-like helical domain-containing protein [Lupinus albus]|uniref:Putative tetratricopeptide-like helical domain-containing protein n=1 Tax=Lupinus albus TaxID=3870 RepID=A0A6A4PIT7_LUPAL|nr:putative tetratricopeptide-like helical domain-containing protein [Lupinus albus]